MSQPAAPPVLTVRYEGSERTFAAGHDVVVGRDLRADVRVAHPLISRAHLLLRFDQGRWVAIDNGSLNGLYLNNRRVPVVDIYDAQRVHIGNPDVRRWTSKWAATGVRPGDHPRRRRYACPTCPRERGPPTAAADRHARLRPATTASTGHHPDTRRSAIGTTAAIPHRWATVVATQRTATGAADLPATHGRTAAGGCPRRN